MVVRLRDLLVLSTRAGRGVQALGSRLRGSLVRVVCGRGRSGRGEALNGVNAPVRDGTRRQGVPRASPTGCPRAPRRPSRARFRQRAQRSNRATQYHDLQWIRLNFPPERRLSLDRW